MRGMYVTIGLHACMYLVINIPVIIQELYRYCPGNAKEGDFRECICTPEIHDLLREHRDFPAHQSVLTREMWIHLSLDKFE